ncbi:hypothetical protein NBRC10512_005787 [Rhodotorula toruloides]|uniref:RHTO0S21e01596g1_1 n=2 Tax=Rhodotorula toruloides TaxID=5286 RepID=A0A061BPC4_RHOTO|nr:uncharacterized protein RHTO_05667 [Rhodotorula toruloides NP11]EMS18737.1 hypothetical protein RHTO_05667 [Rhodotorula toruloides NP11]CDR48917.1 RHTO0S21e01596g1_1 [Rhodotorula toruloides]
MTSLTARRCIVCDAEATKRCSSCASAGVDLFFCSLEHFQQVWLGHSILCGKSPPFCRCLTEDQFTHFKDSFALPLEKTLRLRILQLLRMPLDDRPSLARFKYRKMLERAFGFDPWKVDTQVDEAVTVAAELERLTGTSAETLLRHLQALAPDYTDLIPFHDVLVTCLGSLYGVPSGPRTRDNDWGDKGQLYSLLVFEAAERWLSHWQKTGEPPVDPGHELWWTLLMHRVTAALYSLSQLDKPYRYAFDCHEQCFDTTFACLKRGMDLDDPALSECFSRGMYAFNVISRLLRPELPEEDATPVAPTPRKKAKGGQVKVVRLRG